MLKLAGACLTPPAHAQLHGPVLSWDDNDRELA